MESGEASPPRTFEPNDLVGTLFAERFSVQRLVATGANTAIFDATDEETGRLVTLKLVRPKLAASPSFRTRFDETMRAVAALSHPNISAVYDWGIARVGDTSTAYVVNEHLSGGSLRDLFDRGRRLSPSQALAVGLDTCRALDYAHRRRFVHTELTPSKIVWGDDRRLRIVDFGLARLLGEPAWEQPDSVPNHVAWYAAPEQGTGDRIDGRVDVYALALTLHEAVTGTLPFKDDSTVATLSARVGRLMPVSADLGPLASVLERAGRPIAEERATAAEFGKGLLQAASKLPRPAPLPLLSSGLFDTPVEQMRSPDDPTGGVYRSGQVPAAPLVVPLDEPDTEDLQAQAAESSAPLADAPAPAASEAEEPLVILPLDAEESPAGPVVSPETREAPATTQMPAIDDVYEPESRRRGVSWKILAGVVLVAALVALGVLATRLFGTDTHLVPDLKAMPEAQARNLIAPNEWEIEIQRERSDEVPVVGQVVRTAPAAGVELAEGEPFLIVVSEGPLLRELPDSTGMLLSEARAALEGNRLAVEVVEEFDETIAAGTVISWSVPGDPTLVAGSDVEPETIVQLVVSKGPAPRVVPNLMGRASSEAQVEVEALKLTYVVSEQLFSDDVPIGVIIAQSLEPGTEVPVGSELRVAVSRGPDLVTFPDLSTVTTFEQAAAILTPAGFQPVLTFGDAQGAIQTMTIDGEGPVVGNTYRRGTVVEFTAL